MPNASKLIAIIEDDAVLRRGLKFVFAERDFEVNTFTDVKGLFEALDEKMPDVILCDYKLPSTNGIEILKEVRKKDKQTPFFLMTGYYKDEMEQSARLNGANAVFEKPLDVNQIIDSCGQSIIDKKRDPFS